MSGAAARTGKLRKKWKKNIIEKKYEGAFLKGKTIPKEIRGMNTWAYKNLVEEIEVTCIIILYMK